jgi:hypothetical protein
MVRGEKPFKNRKSTLEGRVSEPTVEKEILQETCKISSKSRAASLFISEVLFANF